MDAVALLQELLKLDTTNPPGDEAAAAELLESELSKAGLETELFKSPEGRVSIVARVEGPSDRPPLVLLSHTDVVGVEREHWSRDPFGGEISDGAIWGRGALDMKGVGAMHAAACATIAGSPVTPARELIFVSVADEEAGGVHGAGWLLDEHPDKVGFGSGPPPEVLGEGGFGITGVIDRPLMPVILGEKTAMWIDVIARGEAGHGAFPPQVQAPSNLARGISKIAGYGRPRIHPVMRAQLKTLSEHARGPRAALFRALASPAGEALAFGLRAQLRKAGVIGTLLSDTTTPTSLSSGYKGNVVPGLAQGSLDCRLLPDTDPDAFIAYLRHQLGENTEVIEKSRHGGPVSATGSLWQHIEAVSEQLPSRPVVVPSLTSGITDVRYFRQRGATGYGWVPLVLPPELLATIHGHDERVPVEGFNDAVAAMTDVVTRALA